MRNSTAGMRYLRRSSVLARLAGTLVSARRRMNLMEDCIMKKLLITLACALAIGAVLPAHAGPDWHLIEQARKAKSAKLQLEATQQEQKSDRPQASPDNDAPRRTVLPLDHGPRAQTTPWVNQRRLRHAEQEAREKAAVKSHATSNE